jgi:two-component system, cell cycle sensor histidine kinase and response regulator CckA
VNLQDITARKRVEQELRQRLALQDQLAHIAATVPGTVYSFRLRPDGSTCIPYASPALERVFGLKLDQVRDDASAIFARVHPDDLAAVKESILTSARTMRVWRIEFRLLDAARGEIWAEGHSVPQMEPDGSVLWHGFVHDVTERRRGEERLRQLSQAVQQSPASIVITDPKGTIEYVNPKFTHTTGYSLEEALGQNPRILKSGELPEETYKQLWETILQGREWRGEFHNRKKNGELFWESASISPIIDTNGVVTHFLAVKEDITERKRLEEQVRQSQKLDGIGQLAGGVAHDFNNVLAAIMMYLGLLRMNPTLDEETRQALKDLDKEAKRAADLTRQLLMFSRRSVLAVKPLDLNDLIADMLKMLRRLIQEDIDLRFEAQAGLPLVEADPGMLEQVLMNLVVNARDALPKGGRIVLSSTVVDLDRRQVLVQPERRPGRFLRLCVSDNGTGMDSATVKRIFEPFFTTKEVGRGTGLGLATVHGIVAQHKGWVEVESTVGQGTVFSVFLPASDKVIAPTTSTAQATSLERGRETILLVEDAENVRRTVGQALRLLGYRVLDAGNGQEAMALWQTHGAEVDLLLTDMVMPEGMTGLELVEWLHALRPGLKVIISSGYSAEIVHAGVSDRKDLVYLPKPYEIKTLAETVRRCLDGKK